MFVWRVDLEAENAREQFEADELDQLRDRVAAGAFVMNIQRKRSHCRRKRHDSDRYAVVQTCQHNRFHRLCTKNFHIQPASFLPSNVTVSDFLPRDAL